MAEAITAHKCPVCLGEFKEPKFLQCGHLVCRKCVLATLNVDSEIPERCPVPVCKQSILPSQEQRQFEFDFSDFVDNLPTDHVTQMKIEWQAVLSGGAVCNICDNGNETLSFCFQCGINLCPPCLKYHSKIPSTSHHAVEVVNTLTAEQFAAKASIPCNNHRERPSEMYCSDHDKLVCGLCVASFHKECENVKNITVSAETMRRDMRELMQRLKQKEASISAQIELLNKEMKDAEKKFKQMKEEVISTYSDIIKMIEKKKYGLLDSIDMGEEAFFNLKLANRDELEDVRSSIDTHSDGVDEMIASAPDMAMLATLGQLKSRLNDLDMKKTLPVDSVNVTFGYVRFDEELLFRVKTLVGFTAEYVTREQPLEGTPSYNEEHCLSKKQKRALKKREKKEIKQAAKRKDVQEEAAISAVREPFKLVEVKGNLFHCPTSDAMAHCVSEDLHMTGGIAAMFKKYFGGVDDLRSQGKRVGEVATLYSDGSFLYYLITKPRCHHKPTYIAIHKSLVAMRDHMMENKVTKLSIPPIGCGNDGLRWAIVLDIISDVFRDISVKITVYHDDGDE